MRAVADDQQASMVVGIKVPRVFAAVVGHRRAGRRRGRHHLGQSDRRRHLFWPWLASRSFRWSFSGGLDSIGGAIIGGLLMGVIESLAAGYLDPSGGRRHKGFHSLRVDDPGAVRAALRLFRTRDDRAGVER